MQDPLVVVGLNRIDAASEQCSAEVSSEGVWKYTLVHDANKLTEKAVSGLSDKLRHNVHTVITCSFAYDSFAYQKVMCNDRIRPSDVMGALGVSFERVLHSYLPHICNILRVDAHCASGLIALDLADMIARRDKSVVLIAGMNKSTTSRLLNLFVAIGAAAKLPHIYSSPFDLNRSGLVMGECAAMLAVTTASQAQAKGLDIVAVIDTVKVQTIFSLTAPSDATLLQQFINHTVKDSQRSLPLFACWDAHATATPQGDEIEYNIFSNIFNHQDTVISSFKGRVGHCMAVSALTEIVNAIQHLQRRIISPNFGLDNPMVSDPRLITDTVSTNKKTFIKTSFGFGGKNAATVITVQ